MNILIVVAATFLLIINIFICSTIDSLIINVFITAYFWAFPLIGFLTGKLFN